MKTNTSHFNHHIIKHFTNNKYRSYNEIKASKKYEIKKNHLQNYAPKLAQNQEYILEHY